LFGKPIMLVRIYMVQCVAMYFYVAMTTQKQKANVYILYSAVQLCIFKRLIKTKK